jgi:hypothetical protein
MQLIFEAKEEGANVLTAEAIRDMFTVYDTMSKAAVSVEDGNGKMSWTNGICDLTALNSCTCALKLSQNKQSTHPAPRHTSKP